jgi:hypothetical protein
MALMKLGIVATDIRGSVGGTVFSRNLGGAYTRARTAPVNRKTPKQTQVRANFSNNSKAWSSLLESSQRAAWTFFAQNNPSVNVLGASIILTGLAMFNKLNQVLAQIGMDMELNPPSDLTVPLLAPVTGASADSDSNVIALQTVAQSVVAGGAYYIRATGALAPGKTPPTSAYRFMGSFPAVAAAVVVDFSAVWEATFGNIIEKQAIGISVQTVNTATGALSPAVLFWITTS